MGPWKKANTWWEITSILPRLPVTHSSNSVTTNADILQCHIDLKYVLKLITNKIRAVREIENIQWKRLLNYEKLNPNPNFKTAVKGACRSHIYDCKVFINNALDLHRTVCKTMSFLQKTSCSFNLIHVSLQNQRNVQLLLPANYMAQNTTVDAHPEWFKQRSPQWRIYVPKFT